MTGKATARQTRTEESAVDRESPSVNRLPPRCFVSGSAAGPDPGAPDLGRMKSPSGRSNVVTTTPDLLIRGQPPAESMKQNTWPEKRFSSPCRSGDHASTGVDQDALAGILRTGSREGGGRRPLGLTARGAPTAEMRQH